MTSHDGRIIASVRAVGRIGPWLSLVIVVATSVLFPQPPSVNEALVARHERIRRVLEGVPLRCGEWIGEEQPLAPAAVELLRPNASLSRSYRRIGSDDRIALSVIHCSDARDMAGHYPPICYPAHGWSLVRRSEIPEFGGVSVEQAGRADEFESMTLTLQDQRTLPLRVYRFSRMGEGLSELKMTILSAFILPDGSWSSELGVVRDMQTKRRATREGVAQIQIVVAGWPATGLISEPASSLLSELPAPVLDALGDVGNPGTEVGDE